MENKLYFTSPRSNQFSSFGSPNSTLHIKKVDSASSYSLYKGKVIDPKNIHVFMKQRLGTADPSLFRHKK
jgi:hypothetical protein